MKPFVYFEHTADVKFRAYGRTIEEMLNNAALALFNAMVDTATVQAEEIWKVELIAPNLEELAYKWLSELIFLFETEFAAFSVFEVAISRDQEWKLEAAIGGERIDLARHVFVSEVKAVTLHQFGIQKNDLWCIQVVLDV